MGGDEIIGSVNVERVERFRRLAAEAKAQQAKYDEACPEPGRSLVPYVALLQIDARLGRLERQLEAVSDELTDFERETLGLRPRGS